MTQTLTFTINEPHAALRIDKALAVLSNGDLSRMQIKILIEDGLVIVNGAVCNDPSRKTKEGDEIFLEVPPSVPSELEPENIPLDIVFEDDHVIVINKPAGMVVHPGAGNRNGTLANALLYHYREHLSSVSGDAMRPGIVHRLDKDTSGLMVVAKTDLAHRRLAAQLEDRSLSRTYQVIVLGVPVPPLGKVDMPIGRHRTDRQKMAVSGQGGREARTRYKLIKDLYGELALLECKLETGRTHQIRVHMQAIKHPVIGDPVYGPQRTALNAALKRAGLDESLKEKFLSFPRQALHAHKIGFIHPETGEEMTFEADMPEDMAGLAGR